MSQLLVAPGSALDDRGIKLVQEGENLEVIADQPRLTQEI
jgi:hypothetical protein